MIQKLLKKLEFEVYRDPIFYIVIKDIFVPEVNEKIFTEALSLEKKFHDSFIGPKGGEIHKDIRSNTVCYYDVLYTNKRDKSVLLRSLEELFLFKPFSDVLATSPYPVNEFPTTNFHETQVSRYGTVKGEKDKWSTMPARYDWHKDKIPGGSRQLTMVYYFSKEPKKWSGGEISFSASPCADGKLVEKDAKIKTITPENNMLVVFSASSLHRVEKTSSPEKFDEGRFSANIWMGYTQ